MDKIIEIELPRVVTVDMAKVMVICGACESMSVAKRLLLQGAVEVDGFKVNRKAKISSGCILKVGKRFWRKLVNTDNLMDKITLELLDDHT